MRFKVHCVSVMLTKEASEYVCLTNVFMQTFTDPPLPLRMTETA